MTDWLMVIITAIYVVATIVICVFNGKSAKAAKEQTEVAQRQTKEMIDQYNATNRPIVTVRFDIIRSGLLCFIIENEGPLPAKDVCVHINEDFIENINDSHKSRINEMNESSFYLASRQKMTILLGGQPSFAKIAKETARIDIMYNDKYNEHTEIDLNQYRFLLVYSSSLEDISQHLKKIKENDDKFHKQVIKLLDKPAKIQNVVVHNETEDEANKYRIFKIICLNPNSTVIELAEKLSLEKDYVLSLLIELNKVDQLISYTFNEVTDDDSKVLWYKR